MFFLRFVIVTMLITLCSGVVHNNAQASSDLNKRISHLYEKVYADPSNVSLNLELVRSQIQIRDFKGASGTLERLLIIAPNNTSAQLLAAQVKIALGNFSEAQVILSNLLDDNKTTADAKERAQTLLQDIKNATDGFSWQASMDVMVGQSQNPENKPSKTSYSLYLPSTPIEVSGASQEFRGLIISGRLEQKFNSYNARKIRLDLSHQRRDYNSYNKSDYEVYSGAIAAISGDNDPFGGTIQLVRVRVRERDFMDQVGIESRKEIMTPFGVSLSLMGYLGRQTHRSHINFSGNEEKTGMIGKASLSGTMMIGKNAVRSTIAFNRKNATKSNYAYHQTKLSFDANLPLFGLNFLSQASLSRKRYDSAGMVYSDRRRRDNTATLAFEVSLPVAERLRAFAPNMRLSMRGDVNHTFSNIDRFTATKSEVMLKASYGWQGQ